MMPKPITRRIKPKMWTIRANEVKSEPTGDKVCVDSFKKNLIGTSLLNIEPIAVEIAPIAKNVPPLDLCFL